MSNAENTAAADLYRQATTLVVGEQKASTSWLQRQLRIGYNVAAQLVERMERGGIVSAPNHVGARTVLVAADALPFEVEADNDDDAGAAEPTPAPAVVAEKPSSEGNSAANQLRLFIERIERMEEEKKGIADDVKDVYLEAKANGYDVKAMRDIVKIRKMERHFRLEHESIVDTYKNALGIE